MANRLFLLLPAVVALTLCAGTGASAQGNIATKWAELHDDILFAALGSGPTVGPNRATAVGQSRAIFLFSSSLYDAWTAFDERAIPTAYRDNPNAAPRLKGSSSDIDKAISYAAFRVMNYLFSESDSNLATIKSFFTETLGYDDTDTNTRLDNPAGIGNEAANKIIAAGKVDGTNSEGDSPIGVNNVPYADYSNYFPINNPKTADEIKTCSGIRAVAHWVPLLENGVAQVYNVPYMPLVRPFALSSATQFQLAGPPLPNTAQDSQYKLQHRHIVDISANLTDLQKLEAEYWAYSSGAELFFKVTYQSATNAKMSLSDTIKLLFAQGASVWDAAIACWSFKRIYDTGRPTTVIPCLFTSQNLSMWGGPYQGTVTKKGGEWIPYLATPPFSTFPSGHSTFTGASAEVLRNFLGSDKYLGDIVCVEAGESENEPKVTNMSDPRYKAGFTDMPNSGPGTPGYTPATRTCLNYTTYTEAAATAGISRLYAGFHISADNEQGLALGKNVGAQVFRVASAMWDPPKDPDCTASSSSTLHSFLFSMAKKLVFSI